MTDPGRPVDAMDCPTHVVAADHDDVVAIASSEQPLERWDGFEARDVDAERLAQLHCLLSDERREDALAAYQAVVVSADGLAVVLRIPGKIVTRLALLALLTEETLVTIGAQLAASEPFARSGWAMEETQAFVLTLARLANLVESRHQAMFVRVPACS